MTVDLSPFHELDIDKEILEFAEEVYCANCRHFRMHEGGSVPIPADSPYCQFWEEETRVQGGMVCSEYVPQGFE